jgi:ribosome-associated translation inhibitor RaiA
MFIHAGASCHFRVHFGRRKICRLVRGSRGGTRAAPSVRVAPLQITFRGISAADAITALIRRRTERLSTIGERLQRCRVLVEAAPPHPRHGHRHRVRVDLTLAGDERLTAHGDDEDAQVAVDRAFDAIGRQLEEEHARRRAGRRPRKPGGGVGW